MHLCNCFYPIMDQCREDMDMHRNDLLDYFGRMIAVLHFLFHFFFIIIERMFIKAAVFDRNLRL